MSKIIIKNKDCVRMFTQLQKTKFYNYMVTQKKHNIVDIDIFLRLLES